jgi:hypothetical protein
MVEQLSRPSLKTSKPASGVGRGGEVGTGRPPVSPVTAAYLPHSQQTWFERSGLRMSHQVPAAFRPSTSEDSFRFRMPTLSYPGPGPTRQLVATLTVICGAPVETGGVRVNTGETGVNVKTGVAEGASVKVGTGTVTSGVGDPSTAMGVTVGGCEVGATAVRVWAMAVLTIFMSGVGWLGAQAWAAISRTKPRTNLRMVFGIFASFPSAT